MRKVVCIALALLLALVAVPAFAADTGPPQMEVMADEACFDKDGCLIHAIRVVVTQPEILIASETFGGYENQVLGGQNQEIMADLGIPTEVPNYGFTIGFTNRDGSGQPYFFRHIFKQEGGLPYCGDASTHAR